MTSSGPILAPRPRLVRLAAPHWWVLAYRLGLTAAAAGGIVLLYGFKEPPLPRVGREAFVAAVHGVQVALMALYFLDVFRRSWRRDEPEAHEQLDWLDYAMLASAAAGVLLSLYSYVGWLFFGFIVVLALVVEVWRFCVTLVRQGRAGLVLPVSFAALILAGTPLLKLPVSLQPGHELTWLDALFTATSAVCVTGLVVHTTAEHFTPVGQAVLGVLIQLGGFGIIIFGSLVALLFGRQMSLREHLNLAELMENVPLQRIRQMVRLIVFGSLAVELLGAIALYPLWDESVTGWKRIGWSVFHSVSAYCNAGFDLTGNSVVPYRHAMLTHAVIAPLIVVGGLGFPVMANLIDVAQLRVRRWWRPRRVGDRNEREVVRLRLTLHTKIALAATAALYLAGFAAVAMSQAMPYAFEALQLGHTAHVERPGTMTARAAAGIASDASFQSITARTAGYNSMPMDELQPGSRFTLIVLMLVGGSPGGTAGGVKTTVIALLLLSVVSTLRQTRETEAFGRAIPDLMVRRAGTVFVCYLALVVLGTLLLTLSEPFPLERLLFEVVSAVATVGMTLGVTPELSGFGKWVVIAMMFLGRVGPLALLGALVLRGGPRRPYSYAHENVVIG